MLPPKEHNLIPGDFFTPEQWAGPLAPFVDELIDQPGGVLLIAVELAPRVRNYPRTTFSIFSEEERADLKVALIKCRKKRETRAQEPRGDVGEAKVSPSSQTAQSPDLAPCS